MMLNTVCLDGFDEPLATVEDGFAVLAAELAEALEDTVIQVDKVLDSECRGLFSEAATRLFGHIHLREPGFDFVSVILPVPGEARDSAAEAVKGNMEALVNRFACIAIPSSPNAAEDDSREDGASDAEDKPPEDGATGGSGSS
ncbi:hypothetical protein D1007_48734 [Hordeum vulgare]|nr:hypothetical protein D1007_48734 [Hordeum vulgare]